MSANHGRVVESGSVRFERLLPGPIERVWAYLVDSDLRATWFAGGLLEPRVGGEVHFTMRHSQIAPPDEKVPERHRGAEGYQLRGRVLRFEPLRAVAYSWDDSEVTFELAPRGDEVLLTLTHRKLAGREERVDVSAGWHVHLDVLRDRLNERAPRRFWAAVEELEREYDRLYPEE